MADEAQSQTPPARPQESNFNRGRRRQGRGVSKRTGDRFESGGGDDSGRGRGRALGGEHEGQGGRGRHIHNQRYGEGGQPFGIAPEGEGNSGDRSTGDARRNEGEEKGRELITDELDDGGTCFICASRVAHISLSPCNHRTCHICALRLRALYKSKSCAHCRTESPYVIFTDNPTKLFEEFTEAHIVRTDDNLGIRYEREEILEDCVILLRYNCPDKECDVACLGWPDLHRHVKSQHGKSMCDLCTRNKKAFTHEHELFTTSQLRKHERHGDDNPGAVDQSGFRGHPECGFCRQRFYGDDELYTHCMSQHERCYICDRRSGSPKQQYYLNYDALENHFQKDHFLCLDKECLEKKFVVFESQMDLKAHQLESHPEGLSKDARRDARIVDMSTFDYRTPYQFRRQRAEGHSSGRGRDPDTEPLPVSSAQPLRRDELAYQRQMALQTQPLSTRSLGANPISNEPQSMRVPARPASHTAQTDIPATATTARTPSTSVINDQDSTPLTPQEQARRLRHAAVIERASNLLQNDQRKISEFRTKVSSYQMSAVSATDLIDALFSISEASGTELGKLIKELAEIYEDESKRNSLLKAWNDWRAINEDYPALPGLSPGVQNGTGASAGGKRVLRLKSSTAQSSRAAVGRTNGFPGNMSSGNPFPPLSSTAPKTKTAWASASPLPPTSRTPPVSSGPSARPVMTVKPSGGPITADKESFPALPAAPKPNTLMAGLTRGTVRWDDRRNAPSPNAWGTSDLPSKGGGGVVSASATDTESGETSKSTGKKGKGKKGKQTIFHFG